MYVKPTKRPQERLPAGLTEFSDFITSHKSGVKPFSEDIVSFRGMLKATFSDEEEYKKYIKEKFEQHIFTDRALAAAFKRAIAGGVKDIESIENELAVALRQEILDRSLSPEEIPIAVEKFEKAMERVVTASQRGATKSASKLVASELIVSRLVISEVARQVVQKVLARLGVSVGALAAGAGSSWWSLGATLVIGIVVDQIWKWVDDPAEDVEREMIATLDKRAHDMSTAIEEEMKGEISQRRKLWDRTIAENSS